MSEVISLINEKGGVGKSSSAITIAQILSISGYSILLIDLDTIFMKYLCNLRSSVNSGWKEVTSILPSWAATIFPSTVDKISTFSPTDSI